VKIQLILDIPDEIVQVHGLPVIKRAAKTGIITEMLAVFRQRNNIRGQSSAADRYLESLRENITVTGEILP
jgi:hypothetical protein